MYLLSFYLAVLLRLQSSSRGLILSSLLNLYGTMALYFVGGLFQFSKYSSSYLFFEMDLEA